MKSKRSVLRFTLVMLLVPLIAATVVQGFASYRACGSDPIAVIDIIPTDIGNYRFENLQAELNDQPEDLPVTEGTIGRVSIEMDRTVWSRWYGSESTEWISLDRGDYLKPTTGGQFIQWPEGERIEPRAAGDLMAFIQRHVLLEGFQDDSWSQYLTPENVLIARWVRHEKQYDPKKAWAMRITLLLAGGVLIALVLTRRT